ncbi:MAG: class I SAM-dependent methyltransferase [Ardenticatenaceae bacterium]|nr:class I SAM-dependent methyltransferase [Ardenticatenaceae bacterium]
MLWKKLIRFGFRLLYNELAWTYDAVSWLVSLGDWRSWQQAALPFVLGPDVLEIGHGPGHMLLALRQAGFRVVGLDLSPYMGRQAQKRLGGGHALSGVEGDVPLIRGDVLALPVKTAVFDTVLSTFPTDYIIDPTVLLNVNRVLRENGRFIIVPEGHLTGRSLLHRFIEWLYAITGQRAGPFVVDKADNWPDHPVWQKMVERFIAAGFHLEMEQIHLPRSAVTILTAHKGVGSTPFRLIQSEPEE